MNRRLLALALACLALPAGLPRPATAQPIADSTALARWKLANGLEVRARHVPGMTGVVIATGYRSGTLGDPPGREGLAELLTEVQFFSAAGDVPERTRLEMPGLRPLGWSVRTTGRVSLLTEIASLPQFPGALRQVATRMRGATVTPQGLAAAIDTVRAEMASRASGVPSHALYWGVYALARGLGERDPAAAGAGRGLARLKAKEVEPLLRTRFVPANACLALIGDFTGVDLRTLIEREFGSIPGGSAQPDAPKPELRAGKRATAWPGLDKAVGAVGIIAPAVDDSLHPEFHLAALMTGMQLRSVTPVAPPLTHRFQYSVFEQPELVRLYPSVASTDPAPDDLAGALFDLSQAIVKEGSFPELENQVKGIWDWVLGGNLPENLRREAQRSPELLTPLAGSMVARALWLGDGFWDVYRLRFESAHVEPARLFAWMNHPATQALYLLVPGN